MHWLVCFHAQDHVQDVVIQLSVSGAGVHGDEPVIGGYGVVADRSLLGVFCAVGIVIDNEIPDVESILAPVLLEYESCIVVHGYAARGLHVIVISGYRLELLTGRQQWLQCDRINFSAADIMGEFVWGGVAASGYGKERQCESRRQ